MAVMIIKLLSLKWLGCMIANAASHVFFSVIQQKDNALVLCTVYLERLFKVSEP